MDLSIVIPSYKGAKVLKNNVPGLIDYLKKKNISFEIIIVDDGSKDNGETQQVAESMNCLFISNPKNLGKGGAVRNGMLKAQGNFRIFTDVDIPFEHDAFDRFLAYLDLKEFDVVVGDRTLPGSSYFTEIPAMRKLGSNIFSFVVGRFVVSGHHDTQCGMKGFRANIAQEIFSVSKLNGFAFDVELLYISLKRNYDIKRLPVVLRCQEGSSVNLFTDSLTMLIDIFKIKYYQLRGYYRKK